MLYSMSFLLAQDFASGSCSATSLHFSIIPSCFLSSFPPPWLWWHAAKRFLLRFPPSSLHLISRSGVVKPVQLLGEVADLASCVIVAGKVVDCPGLCSLKYGLCCLDWQEQCQKIIYHPKLCPNSPHPSLTFLGRPSGPMHSVHTLCMNSKNGALSPAFFCRTFDVNIWKGRSSPCKSTSILIMGLLWRLASS